MEICNIKLCNMKHEDLNKNTHTNLQSCMASKFSKMFLGWQPFQEVAIHQCLRDWLCCHHYGSDDEDTVGQSLNIRLYSGDKHFIHCRTDTLKIIMSHYCILWLYNCMVAYCLKTTSGSFEVLQNVECRTDLFSFITHSKKTIKEGILVCGSLIPL